MKDKIILASRSNVRKNILNENGITCEVLPANIDEEQVKESLLKEKATPEIISNLLTPRNLSDCQGDQCKYVLYTNYEGGILSDPILLRIGKDHWWYSISDSDLLLWAMGVAGKDKYDIELKEPDVSPLQIQGPKSRALMTELFGSWINDLKYYWCKQTEIKGIPVVVSRTGWSGEIGYEVYLRDGKKGAELYEMIMAAGAKHKIAPTGPSQIRRVEAGIFSYFQDMRVTDNPFEIGMDRLVDLDMEADFVGKEALKKIKKETDLYIGFFGHEILCNLLKI